MGQADAGRELVEMRLRSRLVEKERGQEDRLVLMLRGFMWWCGGRDCAAVGCPWGPLASEDGVREDMMFTYGGD